ncbi:GerAB/ArcD/ProY family transporter [Paenibacillus sp. JCM 10914]|uniref:GerAB/ArcD/ProY family transporter n=1 Tax=Paenibacillus sp. JCM 10914 TaxID=1236974 RepID=UPI0003CCBB1B|nr:GerAB/ArcD/ProY family transporter [Paenibacillus sp. JCM 10914]GAE08932.1 spore germination protein GerKB [Paenibacillus sp. JCM 10914]
MNRTQVLTLFILLHLASIFSIFPERIISATSQGHWIPVAILFLVELLVLWLYLKALSKFPGQTVLDICNGAVSKWGTRLIAVPLLIFLYIELLLLMYFQSVEIKAVLLQRTPTSATSAVFIILCFYAAWKGLTVLVRASVGLCILLMPFILFSMLISIKNYKFSYIFPIWDSKLSFFSHTDFYVCTVILAGFLFLGMIPAKQGDQFRKVALAVGIIFVFALGSVYVPLLVFGQETVANLQYPMLMASDTIDLEWVVFDWLPSFYVVASSALGVLKVSVLLWMLVELVHQLFAPRINRIWVISLVCVSLYLISLWIPNVSVLDSYLNLNTYFCLYSVIVFPIIVFVAAQWRRKKVSA